LGLSIVGREAPTSTCEIKMDPQSEQPKDKTAEAKEPQWNLAKWIIIFSFAVVGVLGVASIVAIVIGSRGVPKATPFKDVEDVLSMLLPVIGAWVGTVLAYYFSKENFESAAQNTKELVGLRSDEKLRSIAARDAMIPIDKATKLVLEMAENQVKLKADIIDRLLSKPGSEERNRLPIVDPQGRPKYIAHRSTIDKFIVRAVSVGKMLPDLTLQDLLDDPVFKEVLVKGFNTLRETSSLADAKALIDRVPICLDVFVTEDGTPTTKVLGWLTNVIILERSRV
jgi:hypothetical protein